MGQCHRRPECKYAEQCHLPTHRKDQSCGRCDTFSALEIHVKWKIVSKHDTRCRINRQQRQHIRIFSGKKCTYNKYSDHTLKRIAEQRDCSCLRSERTEHVRRPRIAAPAFADVDPMQPSVNIAGLKQTKYIAYDNTN